MPETELANTALRIFDENGYCRGVNGFGIYTPGNPEPIYSPAEPIFIEYSQRCFTAPSLVRRRSRRRGRNRSRRRSRGRQAPFAGAVCVRQLRFRHNCSFGALLYR